MIEGNEDFYEEKTEIKDAVNTEHPYQNLDWFVERIGKEIYRTSRVYPKLCYRLKMIVHLPYKKTIKFRIFRDIPEELKEELKGCGEWVTIIREDNMPKCLEDCKRLFDSQAKWGLRFFAKKPIGYKMNKFSI